MRVPACFNDPLALPWEIEHRHLTVTRRVAVVLDRALALVVLVLGRGDATTIRDSAAGRSDFGPQQRGSDRALPSKSVWR